MLVKLISEIDSVMELSNSYHKVLSVYNIHVENSGHQYNHVITNYSLPVFGMQQVKLIKINFYHHFLKMLSVLYMYLI